jgi:hypothetical protein
MSVKQRLTEYIEHKKISKSEFCRTIGVSNAFVSIMRQSIQPDKIESIALHFPELNITWLLTGSGDMVIDKPINQPIASDFMEKVFEMYQRGDIFPAVVVRQKNEEINRLHEEIGELRARIKELEKREGKSLPDEDVAFASSG